MKYGPHISTLLLVAANILVPISIIVFATGFFPYKPFLPGLAEYEALEFGAPPDAPFDKLVFMVVDALRSDFVYSENSGFEFVQSLIRDGDALPFTANSLAPTVTMPRIKAITTGSIPSFVDLILNFDEADTSSTLSAQDTWLAQLKAKDTGKLLMYGDDTWLKLFPDTFNREDGTTSFFVADFTEVDNNVTRNVTPELENNDWGLMVLHYLGMDHIGHKAGPRSPHMVPKQREMDSIVQTIFEAMTTNSHLQSTLLVLCGDHGMNDAGNHGASSPGETSPALVFMSPKLRTLSRKLSAPASPKSDFDYYSIVEQSDIAPTLAALFGFPIPKNNLGAFILDFLPFWSKPKDKIQILIRNARQILNIVSAAFGSDLFDLESKIDPCMLEQTDINQLACEWRNISHQADIMAREDTLDELWLRSISKWLRDAQNLMSGMASNYNTSRLYLGQGLSIAGLLLSIVAISITSCKLFTGTLVPITLIYGIMMFGSSYVEEEQHFWYWSSTLWLAYLGAQGIKRTKQLSSLPWCLIALLALRITRSWNQTGQKFAGLPDIVQTFLLQSPTLLWILVSATYCFTAAQILTGLQGAPYIVATALASTLTTAAFSFKLAFTAESAPELVTGFAQTLLATFGEQSLLARARFVFVLILVSGGFAVYQSLSGSPRSKRAGAYLLHHLCVLLAMTQSRVTNIPLFLLSTLILHHLQSLPLTVSQITISSILLQGTTFFAFGGSNSISSVDLSSAYNGISDFNVLAVGFLTLISNWSGPVFWTSATNLILLDKYHEAGAGTKSRGVWKQHFGLLTFWTMTSMGFVMMACVMMRTHLFVWTVFSPKYLYCMAWSLGQHLLINVGFGGLAFWLGTR